MDGVNDQFHFKKSENSFQIIKNAIQNSEFIFFSIQNGLSKND